MAQEPLRPTPALTKEYLEEAVSLYEDDLGEAVEWLARRGVDETTALMFRLGVVNDPAPGHEKYRGMLAIPYLNHAGEPIRVRFRCLRDHNCKAAKCAKYMSVTGDTARIFNIQAVHRPGHVIDVCEGEFDAIILEQLGLNAIALPGATSWRYHYGHVLNGFSLVRVWGDPDEAGGEMNRAVMKALTQAKPMKLEQDVSDTFLKLGEAGIREIVGV